MKKFRVYDTIQKKYLPSLLSGFMVDTGDDKPIWQVIGEILKFPQYIVEQFTGLYDKNNNPIYEGDIIKHGCRTQYYESVVIFKAPSFLAANFYYKSQKYWKIDDEEWYVEFDKKGIEAFREGYYRCNMQIENHYCEVIGNINENPELLKN